MDEDGVVLHSLGRQLIDRCRHEIQAAWEQLEAAWRSIGRMPRTLVEQSAEARTVRPYPAKTSKRRPRSLAKASPLRLKKAGATMRRTLKRPERQKPQDQL